MQRPHESEREREITRQQHTKAKRYALHDRTVPRPSCPCLRDTRRCRATPRFLNNEVAGLAMNSTKEIGSFRRLSLSDLFP